MKNVSMEELIAKLAKEAALAEEGLQQCPNCGQNYMLDEETVDETWADVCPKCVESKAQSQS